MLSHSFPNELARIIIDSVPANNQAEAEAKRREREREREAKGRDAKCQVTCNAGGKHIKHHCRHHHHHQTCPVISQTHHSTKKTLAAHSTLISQKLQRKERGE